MNKAIVQEIVDALEWAEKEHIPQHRGNYTDPNFYSNSLKECPMCAIGVIYANVFGEKPLPSTWAYQNPEYIDARQRLSEHFAYKYYAGDLLHLYHQVEELECKIVGWNDTLGWSFQSIADQLKYNYLKE